MEGTRMSRSTLDGDIQGFFCIRFPDSSQCAQCYHDQRCNVRQVVDDGALTCVAVGVGKDALVVVDACDKRKGGKDGNECKGVTGSKDATQVNEKDEEVMCHRDGSGVSGVDANHGDQTRSGNSCQECRVENLLP